jgi:hypothetical protein
MPRFVVLHHVMPAGTGRAAQWDFMMADCPLAERDRLATWALEVPPETAVGVEARRLPDHRAVYLGYEGPLSGGRGHVRRWDEGEWDPQPSTATGLRIGIRGRRLAGQVTLVMFDEPLWRFTFRAHQQP